MTTRMPDYVTVAGVRTPADWTIEELRSTLEKRKIRFGNEEEILAVYGRFLKTKNELTEQIKGLEKHRDIMLRRAAEAETLLKNLNLRLTCPKCQNVYSTLEEPVEVKPKAKVKAKAKE